MKTGEKPNRTYAPDPLLQVARVRVEPDGIVGLYQGADVLDVHHRAHPHTRNSDGLNGLSIGFASHYRAMAGRFGAHVWLGCAGENLLVDCDHPVTMEEIGGGFTVLDAAGGVKLTVHGVRVATPCRPFSGFALGGARVAPQVMKETLQFLDDGMRGYYAVVDGVAEIAVGDVVAAG